MKQPVFQTRFPMRQEDGTQATRCGHHFHGRTFGIRVDQKRTFQRGAKRAAVRLLHMQLSSVPLQDDSAGNHWETGKFLFVGMRNA